MYLYRVNYTPQYVAVEVGIFDPEKFDGKGGMRFGYTADVRVDTAIFGRNPEAIEVAVSQASIGSTSVAEAQLRVDVYQAATDVGHFVLFALREPSATVEEIGASLASMLPADAPSERPHEFLLPRR
jgi:hypothetical protein